MTPILFYYHTYKPIFFEFIDVLYEYEGSITFDSGVIMESFGNVEIDQYAVDHSTEPSKLCDELDLYTKENIPMSQMVVGKLEASFLGLLIRLRGVKSILELGTFTGYSALAMAEHLPDDGEIVTVDISKETTDVAKNFWQKSPHKNKINLFLGSGKQYFKDNPLKKFDLVFIDADKENYPVYFELALQRLNERGIILLDNALWSGKPLKGKGQDLSTDKIIEVNEYIQSRDDLYKTLLPIRDGLYCVMKK